MYIYVNGDFLREEDAKISVFDHGFMYGLGLFETFRIYQGHPFLLDDHFQRLKNGLKELNIVWPFNRNKWLNVLNKLINKNNLHEQDVYVRFNVSAGVGKLGLEVDPYTEPTTIIYVKPIPASAGGTEKSGIILNTKRNSPEGMKRLKSHHFLNNIYGKREVGRSVECEGIFLNQEGYLAEGVVSNLFWVKDGMVYTPCVNTGILDGITRRFILTLLKSEKIPFEVGLYPREALLAADEVFVTNSIQEIVPLVKVDEVPFIGRAGEMTCLLQSLYQNYRTKLWTRHELEGKD